MERREQSGIVPCVRPHMADRASTMQQQATNRLLLFTRHKPYGVNVRSLMVVVPAAPKSSTGSVLCVV